MYGSEALARVHKVAQRGLCVSIQCNIGSEALSRVHSVAQRGLCVPVMQLYRADVYL